jgi:hypothetical protein
MQKRHFIFRNNQSIGEPQAELDNHYLSECFVNTGDLEILTDCQNPKFVIVGRTGAGKSALISKIYDEEEIVINIQPESLALTYISNSNIINFCTDAGVKMDIFYRMLWRHIFVVEVLRQKFHLTTEESKSGFLNALFQLVNRNKQNEQAVEYLKKWGESFWKETEYRVREITNKFEGELSASVSAVIQGVINLNSSAARKLSEEQKIEVVHKAQEVVNGVQIAELSKVMKLLNEVLGTDSQRKYYIIIDKLDEDWVEDRLRFRLIRALIETALDFVNINNVKIIFAIRNDLLERVYRYTRDSGFQEEKYRSCMLQLKWTRPQLISLLDIRIQQLVREQYTSQSVTHEDLLPKRIRGKQKSIDYMLDRTLMRPRDLILFFNECIRQANGEPIISVTALQEAEGIYSRERLRALADEWYGLYPYLFDIVSILKRRKETFLVEEITFEDLQNNYLAILTSRRGEEGIDLQYMNMAFDGSMSPSDYRTNLLLIFYKVGLIGIKTDPHSRISWIESGSASVSSAEIRHDSKVAIHKTFFRCLGIDSGDSDDV